MRKLIAAVAVAASAMTASARSLIHYFDFDTLRGGALAYQGADKGTSPADFTFKQDGSAALGYTAGAFGSGHAFYASNKSSIWLGDGSASLGCGTAKGFTISFWLKTSSSHGAWTDFFGFRVGGCDYRLEYTTDNSSEFTLYSEGVGEVGYKKITEVAAGSWTHVALVFTPNSTNTTGTASIYVGGKRVRDMVPTAGSLQQIFVGARVRQAGADRLLNYSNTGIDELAVFDYPATAEQIKWLAKYKPAQPANGPGRAMPLAYLLDQADDNGLYADNSGCGTDAAYKWRNGYANWCAWGMGALDSSRAFILKDATSFRVDGASATEGLGASLDSGMTLSFWVKAPASVTLWSDFMSFLIGGNQYKRFEWSAANPMNFTVFGSSGADSAVGNVALKANAWQNVCMVWNSAVSKMEFYLDGEKTGMTLAFGNPTSADVLKSLTFGPTVFGNNGGMRLVATNPSVLLDEIAVFNHSFSPAQIQWLANNVPCLPSLDATNLVRTVSADGVWAGGRASWTVREWDDANETWANTTRTTIYPTLEDTEVEVAVALADGVKLTNDTFVTPKQLSLMSATSAALPVSATLKCAEDSRFAPEVLDIGDGLRLTVPLYAVSVGGTLTFGTDAKIVFDVSNYDGGDVALVTDGIALPAGESDALAHFGVTDSRFALSLSDDGKTVYARLDNVAATATWTGAGDGTSLNSAANWECRNGSGVVLQDVLPCELTRVIVCSGSAALNAPTGTAIPWQYLRFEAGNVTLSAAETDWRGLPSLTVPEGVTVNLGGNKLYLNEVVAGLGTFTDTAATGGELHFNIPEGVTFENEGSSSHATRTLALTGTLKMVKDGAGTFVASRTGQSYSGGTYVAVGTLRCGSEPSNRILGAAAGDVVVSADGILDLNGLGAAYEHLHVLNGGKMLNTRADMSVNYPQVGNVRLGANSCIEVPYSWGLIGSDYAAQALDLGGYSLSVDVAVDREFYLLNTEVRNGLIDLTHGGWLVTGRSPASGKSNNDIIATNVDFRVNAALKLYAKVKARNYEAVWSGNYNEGSAVFEIYGTFKPSAHNYFHGCKMMDGSTIDLSSRTNALPLVSSFTSGAKTLTFETDKTVYVKFGGYRASSSTPIISWTAKPADIDTVKFKTAPGERSCSFITKDDGLYIMRGFIILVR